MTVGIWRAHIVNTVLLRFDSKLVMFLGLITSKTFLPHSGGEMWVSAKKKKMQKNKDTERPFQRPVPCGSFFFPFSSLLKSYLAICLCIFCWRYRFKKTIKSMSLNENQQEKDTEIGLFP